MSARPLPSCPTSTASSTSLAEGTHSETSASRSRSSPRSTSARRPISSPSTRCAGWQWTPDARRGAVDGGNATSSARSRAQASSPGSPSGSPRTPSRRQESRVHQRRSAAVAVAVGVVASSGGEQVEAVQRRAPRAASARPVEAVDRRSGTICGWRSASLSVFELGRSRRRAGWPSFARLMLMPKEPKQLADEKMNG